MKRISTLLIAAAALLAAACTRPGASGTRPTDSAESYARAVEELTRRIDTQRFKIYGIRISEREALSDDLYHVTVQLVNADDQTFTQTLFLDGTDPSELSQASLRDAPRYATTRGISPAALDPAAIAAQIARARELLPEGYTYRSVGAYRIDEEVPASSAFLNRNRQIGRHNTSLTLLFTEDGKETESSGGRTATIYYEATARVADDGSVVLEEN